MTFKTLIAPMIAIAPLALLAACGGSGTEESATTAAETTAAEAAPSEAAAAPETTPAAEPTTVEATTEAVAASTAPPVLPIATPTPIVPVAATEVAAATPMAAPAAFAVCKACHSVEHGKNGVGPSLHGIVGTKAGDVPGYAFSPALKKSGITWDRKSLDTWLQGPMKMVPGTKMVISVPDAAKRKAIIDYLASLK